MEPLSDIDSVLRLAIEKEEEAYNIYTYAASRASNDPIRQRLQELAQFELGHKAKLEDVRAGNVRWAIRRSKAEPVTDLRLSDHLVGGTLSADADFQDVLLFAAQREKTAYEFYKAMGEQVAEPLHKSVFQMLADEELRHKYIVEKTYEEVVYQEF